MAGEAQTNRPPNMVKCPFSVIETEVKKKINENKLQTEVSKLQHPLPMTPQGKKQSRKKEEENKMKL